MQNRASAVVSRVVFRLLVLVVVFAAAPAARAVDSDGDGVDDLIDCRPADGTTWYSSSQARSLGVTGGGATSLSWLAPTPAPATAGNTVYDVLRSNGPGSWASAVCLASNTPGTSASNVDLTTPSNVYFYLVRAKTACGGELGENSSGVPTVGTNCSSANGSACGASAACNSGYCCGSVCRDVAADTANCGSCGNACPNENATPTCSSGNCGLICNSGFRNCDGLGSNGCEINANTDVGNCGNCGLTCPSQNATPTCTSGTCGLNCNTGFANCDGIGSNGCETNTASNTSNCGSCGNVCPNANATATCTSGSCGLICNAGFRNCDGLGSNGCEINSNTDTNNCGNCGLVCPNANATATCTSGTCGLNCNTGFANCDGIGANGCETNTTNTASHCGSCGNVCPGLGQPFSNVTCAGSSCSFSCQGEHYDVNNNPSNGCEEVDNPTGNHTSVAAVNLGSRDCFDSTTLSFSGVILSDSRAHASPSIVGFDATTGSAPDWVRVTASGGAFCSNDLSFSFSTSGGGATPCYRLTIQTNLISPSCTATGAGGCSINQGSGSYDDNTTILFRVDKLCSSATRERVTYFVNGHL